MALDAVGFTSSMDRGAQHYAAIVTPFDDADSLDERSLESLCEDLVGSSDLTGLVANANAAEVDALTQDERRAALRVVARVAHSAGKQAVAGLAPVPSSFGGAVENARQFVDDGADALLLLGPTAFGRGIRDDAHLVGEYCQQVFEASGLPIVYFLAGALSGIDYTPAAIEEICRADGVVAVKDTTWTTEGFASTRAAIKRVNPRVQVFTGNDNCVMSTFVAGAEGSLLVLNCVFGHEVVGMFHAVHNNDIQRAAVLDGRIAPVVKVLFEAPMLKMVSRVKAALVFKGVLKSARTRLPVPALTSSEQVKIDMAMRDAEQHGVEGSVAGSA